MNSGKKNKRNIYDDYESYVLDDIADGYAKLINTPYACGNLANQIVFWESLSDLISAKDKKEKAKQWESLRDALSKIEAPKIAKSLNEGQRTKVEKVEKVKKVKKVKEVENLDNYYDTLSNHELDNKAKEFERTVRISKKHNSEFCPKFYRDVRYLLAAKSKRDREQLRLYREGALLTHYTVREIWENLKTFVNEHIVVRERTK